ncbi:hypothetical protein MPSI1_003059 [Malassezia psittaci]|uniref:Uncharacterized protein n=1 Tax=Malassezia psittaci TaxID=1821823 RepID=A0AAF0F727_9BASI|nr:hypothetical protein MPSI1_003059 [Malassezia psittaci]
MDPWASPWGDEVHDVPIAPLQRVDLKQEAPAVPLEHDTPWSVAIDRENDVSLGGWGTESGPERKSPVVQDSYSATGDGLETITEPFERIQLSKPDQIDLDPNLAHLATEAVTIESNVWGSGETLQDRIWNRNGPAEEESDEIHDSGSDSAGNHANDGSPRQSNQALDDQQVPAARGKQPADLHTEADHDASQSKSTLNRPSQSENTSAISKLGAVVSNWRRRPTDAPTPTPAQPAQPEPDPGWKCVAAPTASTTRKLGGWLGRNPQPDSQPQRTNTGSPSVWNSWRRTPQTQSPVRSATASPKPKKETRKPPLPPAAALSEVDLSWLDKEITHTPPLDSALEVFTQYDTYADDFNPDPISTSASARKNLPQVEFHSPIYQDEFSSRHEERYDATIDQPNQLFTDDEESDDQGASEPVDTHISQHPRHTSNYAESDDWSEFLSWESTKPKQSSTSNPDDLWSVFETKPIHRAQAAQQANTFDLPKPTLQSKKPILPLKPPPPPARASSSQSHRAGVGSSKSTSLPSSNTPTPLASRVSSAQAPTPLASRVPSAQHSNETKRADSTTKTNTNTNSKDYLSSADLTFFESL